jgi:hypothetical protein
LITTKTLQLEINQIITITLHLNLNEIADKLEDKNIDNDMGCVMDEEKVGV